MSIDISNGKFDSMLKPWVVLKLKGSARVFMYPFQ
jgi:hypothetical protein